MPHLKARVVKVTEVKGNKIIILYFLFIGNPFTFCLWQRIIKVKVRRVEPNVVLIGKFSAIGHQNARLYVSIVSAFSTL